MEQVEIAFPGASDADSSRMAEDLASHVRKYIADAHAELVQGSLNSMDFGTSVAIVLGTPAVIALARGLADWIRRQGDPDIVIKTKKGEVSVKGRLDVEAKREIIMAAIEKGTV